MVLSLLQEVPVDSDPVSALVESLDSYTAVEGLFELS